MNKICCSCCGESNIEFLTISKDKTNKKLNGICLSAFLKKHKITDDYRILCHNCNIAMRTFGYCPHNKQEEPSEKIFSSTIKNLFKIKNIIYTKEFSEAVDLIRKHRIWSTGSGKAGLVSRKLASTLACNNIPAAFIDATDALHGNLGAIQKEDLLIVLSNSGKTEEVLQVASRVKSSGVKLIAIVGPKDSKLSRIADITLSYGKIEEACPLGLTPTTSTAVMLAICDALALTVQKREGISYKDYARNHHAGYIGEIARKKLIK